MSLLNDLIQTVGLDKGFFYQLFWALILYFVSKKILFQPYLEKLRQKEELTKGRMDNVKTLEAQLAKQQILYEQKAKTVHKEFQKVFNKIKEQAQNHFLKESLKLQEEHKSQVAQEREKLSQNLKEQREVLQKELPTLTKLLVEKITGPI